MASAFKTNPLNLPHNLRSAFKKDFKPVYTKASPKYLQIIFMEGFHILHTFGYEVVKFALLIGWIQEFGVGFNLH